MNSRDAILQRIRTELTGGPTIEEPLVPEVWPQTGPSTEQLVERFTGELQDVQGEVVRGGSMDEARQKLAELADQSQWEMIGSVDRPICREVAGGLAPEQVAWAADDWQPQYMAELSAGMVVAELLLADTGSCMIACDTPQERLLCYLPPACVVVARTGQLAEHMSAAWDRIARRTADPARRGESVLVTGPSRTADIEKILILGAHGPKRLVVLLVD